MVDGCSETWWTHLSMLGIVPEVKLGDLMSGEEDVPDSIVSCRPNSHWHALEGLRYLEDTAKELEPTFGREHGVPGRLVRIPRVEGPRETVFGSLGTWWPE